MAEKETRMQKQESGGAEMVERTRWGKVFAPAVDIVEAGNELKLFADLPGVDPGSIDVTLEQNVLTIQGNVERNVPEEYELIYQEYEIGDFQRSFTLSDIMDQDNIKADYKHGVLELSIPKKEKEKPKKIAIKAKN
jgi:HSP20 family molecular chaperone IbpA